MKYFKASITINYVKKRNTKPIVRYRTIFIKGTTIMDALTVVNKIRYAKYNFITEITENEYVKALYH